MRPRILVPPTECSFPLPIIAGTPETDAVADSPARCGLADYVWSRDARLGDITAYGETGSYPANTIWGLAQAAFDVTLVPPEHDVSFVQYRYVTQARGELVEATAVATFPRDVDPGEEFDVLLLLHGAVGTNDACAPSGGIGGQAFAALAASYGYFAAAPDYIGMNGFGEPSAEPHAMLVGEPAAQASLDAVRAAARIPPAQRSDVCTRPRLLVWGPSQGGHAALWVDRLAPYYARELELIGTVADTPPSDLSAHAQRGLSAMSDLTLLMGAMFASQSTWYGLEARLGELFASPWDVDLPPLLASNCLLDISLTLSEPAELYQRAVLDEIAAGRYADIAPWSCLTEENSLLTTSIPRLQDEYGAEYAILFKLGELDPIVDPAIERAAFDSLCADELPLVFQECTGAGHFQVFYWSITDSIEFLRDRSAGVPVDVSSLCVRAAEGCSGEPAP